MRNTFYITLLIFSYFALKAGGDSPILKDVNKSLAQSIQAQQYPKREFRAAWVTTFTNLDWPSKRGLSSYEQQTEFLHLIEDFKSSRLNAVIVQVRASSDAFYESEFSPWSEWITGVQGAAPIPYYDPLAFMLKHCHENNLEFHAWFNPLRAISHDRFSSITKNHITNVKPEWFMHYGDSYYYNPGIPEVREYLIKVILEVVKKYDIDGVHLDDYFYPYTIDKKIIPDQHTFKSYSRGFTNIHDWRRDNINIFIRDLSVAIKNTKKHVKFGISPLAIWRNKKQDPLGSETNSGQTSYDNLYCDTKLWVKNGWLDYIAPQLYWSTDNLYANYNTLLSWWNEICVNNTHLYIGHALYKLDQNQKHKFDTAELIQQVKNSRVNSKSQGSIYFRANAFHKNHQDFQKAFTNSIYKHPALLPTMPWIDSIPPAAPINLNITYATGVNELIWENIPNPSREELPYSYAIYRFEGNVSEIELNAQNLIGISKNNHYKDSNISPSNTYTYIITSLDRLQNESLNYVRKVVFNP